MASLQTKIATLIITFVSAVASDEEDSVLTAVQLLWINIIMDTSAALALATDPATKPLLDRKLDTHGTQLFTADMIKMILGQSIYQVIIILIFHFLGHQILGLDHSSKNGLVVVTLVFDTFIFAQIFNSVNCRRLDNKLNIFEGILRNRYSIVITLIGAFPALAFQSVLVLTSGLQKLMVRSSSCSSVVPPSKSLKFPVVSGVSRWLSASSPSPSVFSSNASQLHHSSAPLSR